MGWYYYLQDRLRFPFTAACTGRRAISPLRDKDETEVIGMPGEKECEHEMLVTIRDRVRALILQGQPFEAIVAANPAEGYPTTAVVTAAAFLRLVYDSLVEQD